MNPRGFAWTLVAVTALALGCAASRRPSSAAPTAYADPDTMQAAGMYRTLCAHCHGPDATGYAADHAPSLVNTTFLESASDVYLQRSIEEGRPGTSMAAYSKSFGGPLSPGSIGRLVTWIRSHGPAVRELTPVVAGDSTRGRWLYASNCQSCHGDARARGDSVMLTNSAFLAVASDGFLQHAIRAGRPGTQMVAFQDKLDSLQIADIVAWLRSQARPLDSSRLPSPTGKEPLFEYPHGKDPEFTVKDDRFVGVDQVARALQEHRRLVIIDARPESEWMKAHIVGAVSIPHYQLRRLDEIPEDAWAIAYCACPHHLSGEVVDALRRRGRMHSFVLDEGILEWERRGYPIVAAPGVSLPPAQLKPTGER